MSPYRIADAARISPYPSTIRAQEHEASTSSGSRSSPSKARLIAAEASAANSNSRSMAGADRSFSNTERQTQNEDARFNIGPRKFGNFMRLKRGVRKRVGRGVPPGIDEGVPDYPPPSFQEAISGSLASSSTPTQSSSPASSEVPYHPSSDQQTDLSESEQSIKQKPVSASPSSSESEDSMEIIENNRPNGLSIDRASRMRGNQGIEFPTSSPSSTPRATADISISSPSEPGPSRGRPNAKLSSKFDLTGDDSEEEPQISPVRSTTKRFLSLSPLRTLFPTKHLARQERAFSAHPIPEAPPYSAPANANAFRSTTSLTASSVLRFPFGHSTLTLVSPKPESVKPPSKRLFHDKTKGKEKEREKGKKKRDFDEESNESGDSWEILEKESERDDIHRIEQEPRSLLAVIMPQASIPSPVTSPEISPTRSLDLSYAASTPTTLSPKPSSPAPTEPPTPSWNEPHPLSLRDKKVAEAIEPFLKRRPRKAGHHRVKTVPNPIIIPSSPLGPQVTTVRSRLNPVYNSNDQPATDTEGQNSWAEWSHEAVMLSESETGSADGESTHDLRRALETPLPSSPMQLTPSSGTNTPARRSSSPSSMMISISSPTTPVPALGASFRDGRRGNYSQPDDAPKVPESPNTPSQTLKYTECIPRAKIASLPSSHSSTPPSPSISNSGNIMPSSPQRSRHHYAGRPLPRPPQALQASRHATVDSIYAGSSTYASSSPDYSYASIPEGLLIDFENEAETDLSGSWTPPEELHHPSAPMTPRRLSPMTSSRNTPELSVRSMNTSGNTSAISELSGMSDLDLLAAALTNDSGHVDYERAHQTVLLISDILGHADETRSRDVNMGTISSNNEPNVSLTGRVEVEQRRVASNGRVKVKLSLFGVRIDRCGICRSQYRDEQHASMGSQCQHVFHEHCLRQWLVRSRTCPLCRISWDSGNL